MWPARARRRPSLLGPTWLPVFFARLIHCTRGSPMLRTTSSDSSVHPSPITSNSNSSIVCRKTLPMEYGRTGAQLYVGITTVTRGRALTGGSGNGLPPKWHDLAGLRMVVGEIERIGRVVIVGAGG